MILRWRAVDPAEAFNGQGSTQWTRVHVAREGEHDDAARTLCGIGVPDRPYMADVNNNVPESAPRCKTCVRLAK